MKFLIVLVLCLLAATLIKGDFNKEEAKQKWLTTSEECRVEAGATDSDMQEILKKQPASTYPGSCMRACIMKRFGLMGADGKFVRATALEHVKMWSNNDAAIIDKALMIGDDCEHIDVPDDHCKAATAYCKCFKESAVAHGMENFDF